MKWFVFFAFLGIGFFMIAHTKYIPIAEYLKKEHTLVRSVIKTDKKKGNFVRFFVRGVKHPQKRVIAT